MSGSRPAVLATGGDDPNVWLWDVARRTARTRIGGHANDEVNAIAFSRDGRTLATGGDDDIVRLSDTTTGAVRRACRAGTDGVDALAYTWDGHALATVGGDNKVELWNPDRGSFRTLAAPVDTVWSLGVQPRRSYPRYRRHHCATVEGRSVPETRPGRRTDLSHRQP
ncbi:WD40 repeat domain-containing protein [Streptomyces sp. NPDC058954]|uniref:WD40 repeat domain-containing protein n=1 Tax=Streptomyces sp. NPDC058954 TaxID=3346677 RepID=UPI00368E4AAE